MPPAGFEIAIAAVERQHVYALDRAATGIFAEEDKWLSEKFNYQYLYTVWVEKNCC